MKAWTGKRLTIDLTNQRAWTEEIPKQDLKGYIGGRGLNGRYFLDRVDPTLSPSSPEAPIALSVGPLAGTSAPCSGWTSISVLSPLTYPSKYAHASLPGHFGPQLKFAGYDQLIVLGKAEKPFCLTIEEDKVGFEEAKDLWGKDTVQTTVSIQEKKKDQRIEVLCIGPAGENLVFFANVTNRFSWTGDHVGLGYVFGAKNLKAIVVHGNTPVRLHDPDQFLRIGLALIGRISRDPLGTRLKEEGPFAFIQDGDGFGIKNYSEPSRPGIGERWRKIYLTKYFYGKECCFSCPIHCGRISEVEGNYFGGVHMEGAWSLGPKIGIESWEKILWLHQVCQLHGLDPSSMGSLLGWVMDCSERGILSSQDLGGMAFRWGEEKTAVQLIEWVLEGRGPGKILAQGSLLAAQALGKGLDQVPHLSGMDLPVRDPRSSPEYALSRALFPSEWDYLQSLTDLPFHSFPESREAQPNGLLEAVLAREKRKVLADLNSICPLVLARLPLLSAADLDELLFAATGEEREDASLMAPVVRTMQVEKTLGQRFEWKALDPASAPGFALRAGFDPLPLRFFQSAEEKKHLEVEVARYNAFQHSDDLIKKEALEI